MNLLKHRQSLIAICVLSMATVLSLSACLEGETSNQLPVILDVAYPAEVQPNQAVRITALAQDPDGNDDSLTYHWTIRSGAGVFSREETRTIPSVTYTAPTETGPQSLEIRVVDVNGGEAAFTFEINVRSIKSSDS